MKKNLENINTFVVDKNIDEIKQHITNLEINNYESVILEIINADFAVSDLPILIELFSQKQFVVIGVRTSSAEVIEFAKFSNLAIFSKNNNPPEMVKTPQIINKTPTKPTIIRGNLPKGEQVYAKNCDLIITDDLLDNGEAVSDESVMIYGGGYGKVFAGIKNKNASIFVQYFQLKLVCINGVYKKFSKIPKEYLNQTMVITLIDEKLNFKIL
jgi:septum site-determining protein MinC